MVFQLSITFKANELVMERESCLVGPCTLYGTCCRMQLIFLNDFQIFTGLDVSEDKVNGVSTPQIPAEKRLPSQSL